MGVLRFHIETCGEKMEVVKDVKMRVCFETDKRTVEKEFGNILDLEGGKSMNYLDPTAMLYRKFKKDRRKFQDPHYRGPERRLENRRKMYIKKIITKLEIELQE